MTHNISKTGKIKCPKCKGKGRLIDDERRVIYCNICDGAKTIDWVDSIINPVGDDIYSGFDKINGVAIIISERELYDL